MPTNKNRKTFAQICYSDTTWVDYKNPIVKKYITIYGRIKPRYYTKVPMVVQKSLSRAIKNARFMGLIPFTK